VSRFKLNGQSARNFGAGQDNDGWDAAQQKFDAPSDGWVERPAALRASITALGAPKARASVAGEWQEF
jgi:hypothetical protein